jgi:16S rRNA (guanine966-N2)-methyltransferase
VRIIAGRHRGRRLSALPAAATATRPTADRVRQALFDVLWHAPWAGRAAVEGALVLDAFAGTGALGLEALSRGAARAVFLETDRAALAVLRANIAACREAERCAVLAADATRPPPRAPEPPCTLAFLDPPYGKGLVPMSLRALSVAGWIAPDALVCAEVEAAPAEDAAPPPGFVLLAERAHGPARVLFLRPAEAAG